MNEKESEAYSSRKQAKNPPPQAKTKANLSSLAGTNPDDNSDPDPRPFEATFTHTRTVLIGPLPPPEVLAQYQSIDPALVNRIVDMAETETKQRHTLERKWLDAKTDDRRAARTQSGRGQIFGFVISLAFLGGALWATNSGNPGVGMALGGGTVLGLVAIFVTGRVLRDKTQEPQQDNEVAPQDSYSFDEKPSPR